MRASTILAVIAPVALAANTTIVAPGCTTVPAITARPTAGAASTGTGSGSGTAGNGTVGGAAGGAPKPSTIATGAASQQVVSFAFMGVLAAGAAFIL